MVRAYYVSLAWMITANLAQSQEMDRWDITLDKLYYNPVNRLPCSPLILLSSHQQLRSELPPTIYVPQGLISTGKQLLQCVYLADPQCVMFMNDVISKPHHCNIVYLKYLYLADVTTRGVCNSSVCFCIFTIAAP